jgi:predicted RNA-binding protein YlxR (DUF448 family)
VPKKGHRPQRTCLGCGARDVQQKLIRLTVDQGYLKIEGIQGRGGYLHQNQECWQAFISRKGHYRAFHVEISRAHKEELIRELERRDRE